MQIENLKIGKSPPRNNETKTRTIIYKGRYLVTEDGRIFSESRVRRLKLQVQL